MYEPTPTRSRVVRYVPVAVSLLALGGVAAAVASCVDPAEDFDDFGDRVIDAGAMNMIDAPPLDMLPDVTGAFMTTVDPAPVPGQYMFFYTEAELTQNPDGTGTLKLTTTALSTQANGRTLVGTPVVNDNIPVNAAGEFSVESNGVMIPGSANPLTGQDLVADMIFVGTIKNADLICGVLDEGSQVTSPVILDVSGSKWTAVRVTPGAEGDDLPPPLVECPTDMMPDAGVPDAGAPDSGAPDAGS